MASVQKKHKWDNELNNSVPNQFNCSKIHRPAPDHDSSLYCGNAAKLATKKLKLQFVTFFG